MAHLSIQLYLGLTLPFQQAEIGRNLSYVTHFSWAKLFLTGAKRREFSGMIPVITSNNHHSNPQQPIHSLRLATESLYAPREMSHRTSFASARAQTVEPGQLEGSMEISGSLEMAMIKHPTKIT